jgi:hypothetical protein
MVEKAEHNRLWVPSLSSTSIDSENPRKKREKIGPADRNGKWWTPILFPESFSLALLKGTVKRSEISLPP